MFPREVSGKMPTLDHGAIKFFLYFVMNSLFKFFVTGNILVTLVVTGNKGIEKLFRLLLIIYIWMVSFFAMQALKGRLFFFIFLLSHKCVGCTRN